MMKFSPKELRARNNLTQREVAEMLGISINTYNAWEKDISKVSIGKVNALARIFGVELDDIFF